MYVDQIRPEREWSVQVPANPRDLRRIGDRHVLLTHDSGWAEYDLATGKEVRRVDSYREIQTGLRLKNGNTVLGGNSSRGIVLYEIDARGREVGRTVVAEKKHLHIMQRLENGNYWIPSNDPPRVSEVDPSGRIVEEVPVPGFADCVRGLDNGNFLVATGDACKVVEMDRKGRVVSSFGGRDAHPRAGLKWFCGFDVLADGRVAVSNWLGEGPVSGGPHFVEFDRSNRLVWSWDDHRKVHKSANILILE